MASIVENAAKGQRSAMQALYEANKQRVFFIAKSLLADETQAELVAVAAFKQVLADLKAAQITTERQFANQVVCRVVNQCKEKLNKKNPKALRIPANKSFAVAANAAVNDTFACELDYLLNNLPATQKYIFIMHTAGEMEVTQIAGMLNFDSQTVQTAIDAESSNFELLQQSSGKSYTSTYEKILKCMQDAEKATKVPEDADAQIYALIDGIAKPVEEMQRKKKYTISVFGVLVCACLLIAGLVLGLTSGKITFTSGTGTSGSATENSAGAADDTTSESLDAALSYYADIAIKDYGTITVLLDQKNAPITAANFVELAQSGFYDGLTFHRIMEGFMMQGGDPLGNGFGGSDKTIVGEFMENGYGNPLSHTRGAISMARSSEFNSASSQFFIVHKDCGSSLDGKYAVFGYVTEGIEVVDAVCEAAQPIDRNGTIPADAQPVITSVTIRTEASK